MISVDRKEVEQFLRDLVQVDTSNPPGSEARLAHYVAEKMEQLGLKATVEAFGNDRANVIGVLEGEKQSQALLYCGHLDTVPAGSVGWHQDPFGAEVRGDHMYGRGTVDMKSGLAAMVMAAGSLSRQGVEIGGDLIVLCTAGEEVDQIGARTFSRRGGLGNVGGIVIGEPTNLELATTHRGFLWLRISTIGKSAHGAMPDQGLNAIKHMSALVLKLSEHQVVHQDHPLLAKPSTNVGTVQGGTKTNMVPDLCTITVDIRTLPGQRHGDVLHEIQEILNEMEMKIEDFHASVEVIREGRAIETSAQAKIVSVATRVGKVVLGRDLTPTGQDYFTDASVLAASGEIPTIIIGPGDEKMAHQPDENVELGQLHAATEFYAALAIEMLNRK